MNVQGMANVRFLLDLDVESWLNEQTPGWQLVNGNRGWDHIPEIQIWFHYRDANTGESWPLDPAVFEFQSADHAMLFKLTWA